MVAEAGDRVEVVARHEDGAGAAHKGIVKRQRVIGGAPLFTPVAATTATPIVVVSTATIPQAITPQAVITTDDTPDVVLTAPTVLTPSSRVALTFANTGGLFTPVASLTTSAAALFTAITATNTASAGIGNTTNNGTSVDASASTSSKGSNTGVIAGVVVAVLIIAAIAAFVAFRFVKKRRQADERGPLSASGNGANRPYSYAQGANSFGGNNVHNVDSYNDLVGATALGNLPHSKDKLGYREFAEKTNNGGQNPFLAPGESEWSEKANHNNTNLGGYGMTGYKSFAERDAEHQQMNESANNTDNVETRHGLSASQSSHYPPKPVVASGQNVPQNMGSKNLSSFNRLPQSASLSSFQDYQQKLPPVVQQQLQQPPQQPPQQSMIPPQTAPYAAVDRVNQMNANRNIPPNNLPSINTTFVPNQPVPSYNIMPVSPMNARGISPTAQAANVPLPITPLSATFPGAINPPVNNNPFADPAAPGVAAYNHPPPNDVNVFTVTRTFEPSMSDELVVVPGDRVQILSEYDDGWCLGVNLSSATHAQGVFPKDCIQPYEDDNFSDGHGQALDGDVPLNNGSSTLERAPTLPMLDLGGENSSRISLSGAGASPATGSGRAYSRPASSHSKRSTIVRNPNKRQSSYAGSASPALSVLPSPSTTSIHRENAPAPLIIPNSNTYAHLQASNRPIGTPSSMSGVDPYGGVAVQTPGSASSHKTAFASREVQAIIPLTSAGASDLGYSRGLSTAMLSNARASLDIGAAALTPSYAMPSGQSSKRDSRHLSSTTSALLDEFPSTPNTAFSRSPTVDSPGTFKQRPTSFAEFSSADGNAVQPLNVKSSL